MNRKCCLFLFTALCNKSLWYMCAAFQYFRSPYAIRIGMFLKRFLCKAGSSPPSSGGHSPPGMQCLWDGILMAFNQMRGSFVLAAVLSHGMFYCHLAYMQVHGWPWQSAGLVGSRCVGRNDAFGYGERGGSGSTTFGTFPFQLVP